MNGTPPVHSGDSPRDRNASESSEGDVDVQFRPVVNLPLVEVTTNEENEDVLLKLRAKLYRFDSSNDESSEWKERGTGEVKILRHKENNSCRVVMRRDKTLKVCANHFITPWMELKPSLGCEKAFVYTVIADFADEEAKSECLAIKFGSVENANVFKGKFEEAKNIVLTQCSLYNGKNNESDSDEDDKENVENGAKEEAEVTEKLSELNVSKDEPKEA